jgi:hypothetical protein
VITPHGVEKLSTLDKCVLLVLADGERKAAGWFVVGYERLACYCAVEKRAVIRSVKKLEDYGAVAVRKAERGGAGARNGYRVLTHELIYHDPRKKGVIGTPLKVSLEHPKGCHTDTTFQVLTSKDLLPGEAGASVPSSNVVEVDSERAVLKGRAHASKRTGKTGLDLEAIEGLLMSRLKRIDARLAADLAHDCLQVNPHVTTEQILFVLTAIFTEGIPPRIHNKPGFVRKEARDRVRASYLQALDAAAGERMTSARRLMH